MRDMKAYYLTTPPHDKRALVSPVESFRFLPTGTFSEVSEPTQRLSSKVGRQKRGDACVAL